ncbi:hypothetical protein KPH14_012692 [Odynerus spinipes]|uniref:Uncharacterized protein n=1 Tax=Odynerus spinipes TaxID=1348599 RepID=A0AAD9R8N2_9HYME|nr:hypothetical protein KPH14_012692 [Odynerus spinipes]
MFNDIYLEQVRKTDEGMKHIPKESQLNLKNVAERFMVEKFTSRHANARQWMEIFEKECSRFEVTEDTTKIEIFRLFLEKSCLDWYSATLTTLTVSSQWLEWKEKFLGTFSDEGWSLGMYAIAYRYREGSLIDYAMRKEKLLLDMDKDIGVQTLIMLIVAGLPEFIRSKIDREKCENSTGLIHEIKKCESFVSRNSFMRKKEERHDSRKKFEERKPCRNCEQLNKGTRYHPEDSCWFKKHRNETTTIGSNSVLEVDLNTEKNELSHH